MKHILKPLPVLLLTEEDSAIFARTFHRGPAHRWLSHTAQLADRRDAELMFGLGARGCAANEVCVAELFAVGCVINNGLTRVAIRGYEGQYGDPRDDITYFA